VAQKEYRSRPAIISARQLTPEEINKHQVAVHDPIITKISTGEYAPPRPETGAICFGNCGSPSGVAEGKARMVVHEPDVYQVQPGDIMVCPAMSSDWTPVLPLLKGLVTNGGGALGHACVVGREYDIPVVSQTNNATLVINDGERIRVDADQELVFRA
jgi:phosphohistidine swiveling domain-containing protein